MGTALKKAKYKIKHLYHTTYKVNIWVCYGTPDNYFKKQMKNELDLDIQDYLPNGQCLANSKKAVYIIWTRKKYLPDLVHECFHATFFILKDKGLKLDDSSDEAYAYLLAEIFNFAIS